MLQVKGAKARFRVPHNYDYEHGVLRKGCIRPCSFLVAPRRCNATVLDEQWLLTTCGAEPVYGKTLCSYHRAEHDDLMTRYHAIEGMYSLGIQNVAEAVVDADTPVSRSSFVLLCHLATLLADRQEVQIKFYAHDEGHVRRIRILQRAYARLARHHGVEEDAMPPDTWEAYVYRRSDLCRSDLCRSDLCRSDLCRSDLCRSDPCGPDPCDPGEEAPDDEEALDDEQPSDASQEGFVHAQDDSQTRDTAAPEHKGCEEDIATSSTPEGDFSNPSPLTFAGAIGFAMAASVANDIVAALQQSTQSAAKANATTPPVGVEYGLHIRITLEELHKKPRKGGMFAKVNRLAPKLLELRQALDQLRNTPTQFMKAIHAWIQGDAQTSFPSVCRNQANALMCFGNVEHILTDAETGRVRNLLDRDIASHYSTLESIILLALKHCHEFLPKNKSRRRNYALLDTEIELKQDTLQTKITLRDERNRVLQYGSDFACVAGHLTLGMMLLKHAEFTPLDALERWREAEPRNCGMVFYATCPSISIFQSAFATCMEAYTRKYSSLLNAVFSNPSESQLRRIWNCSIKTGAIRPLNILKVGAHVVTNIFHCACNKEEWGSIGCSFTLKDGSYTLQDSPTLLSALILNNDNHPMTQHVMDREAIAVSLRKWSLAHIHYSTSIVLHRFRDLVQTVLTARHLSVPEDLYIPWTVQPTLPRIAGPNYVGMGAYEYGITPHQALLQVYRHVGGNEDVSREESLQQWVKEMSDNVSQQYLVSLFCLLSLLYCIYPTSSLKNLRDRAISLTAADTPAKMVYARPLYLLGLALEQLVDKNLSRQPLGFVALLLIDIQEPTLERYGFRHLIAYIMLQRALRLSMGYHYLMLEALLPWFGDEVVECADEIDVLQEKLRAMCSRERFDEMMRLTEQMRGTRQLQVALRACWVMECIRICYHGVEDDAEAAREDEA